MGDREIEALLGAAEDFTRSLFARFGYVEGREVRMLPLAHALVTRRRYVSEREFTGAVYDGQDRLVASSQRLLLHNPGDRVPVDPPEAPAEAARAARAVRVAVYGGSLYLILGHHLVETIARLWPYLAPRRRRRSPIPFIFHPSPGFSLERFFRQPFYAQSLAAFGVDRSTVIMAAEADLRVDLLYYPEPLSIYHEFLHPLMGRVFELLGDELVRPRLGFGPFRRRAPGPARLYLSRSRWPLNPRLPDEAEVEDLFRARGFAVVHPQDLSPAELVRLMRTATFVAATDGSHAHLVAFCRPGTSALMLDTRTVPTQVAIEKLRWLRSLHLPLCGEAGRWEPEVGCVPRGRLGPLLDRVLRDGLPSR